MMADCTKLKDVLLIADRGYVGYNLLAHAQEKGWKFLICVKIFTASVVLLPAWFYRMPENLIYSLIIPLAVFAGCLACVVFQ